MQKKLQKRFNSTLFHYFQTPKSPQSNAKEVVGKKNVTTPTVAKRSQCATRVGKYGRPVIGTSKEEMRNKQVQKLQKQVLAYDDGSKAVPPTPRHKWNGTVSNTYF